MSDYIEDIDKVEEDFSQYEDIEVEEDFQEFISSEESLRKPVVKKKKRRQKVKPPESNIIIKLGFEESVLKLRRSGFSYEYIAEGLSKEVELMKDLPFGTKIDKYVLHKFFKEFYPDLAFKSIEDTNKKLTNYSSKVDIMADLTMLRNRTLDVMDKLDNVLEYEEFNNMNIKSFKSLADVLLATTAQIANIQKEVNDYQNVIDFIEVVIEVIHIECPEVLPIIMDKLKMQKNTRWFSDIVGRREEL